MGFCFFAHFLSFVFFVYNVYIFFLIDKHQNILEKAIKPHVYRGYTQTPKKKS